MSSDCEDKRVYLEDILKTDITKYPKWFQKFANTKNAQKKLRCGANKAVYTLDDVAISIEAGRIKIPHYYEILKQLPKEYQKHFIYPEETFYTKDDKYTVARMSNCGNPVFHVDLGTALNIPPLPAFFKLNEGHFQELAQALQILHEYDIAVCDLKGPNIMYCKCDCLAFIDMDSCMTFTGEKPNFEPSAMTPYVQPIVVLFLEGKTLTKTDYYASDWVAYALVLLNYFAIKIRNLYPDLWNMILKSNNENDLFYIELNYRRLNKNTLQNQVKSVLMTDTTVSDEVVLTCLALCWYLFYRRRNGRYVRLFNMGITEKLIRKLKGDLGLWRSLTTNLKF